MTQSNGPHRAPVEETTWQEPSLPQFDQIVDSSDLIEYGVPHGIPGYEAESVSCRISNLLQSLEPQLLRLDSSVGLRLRLSIFFRGGIPILHQARISKTTICPVHQKPTADAADSICAITHEPREQHAVLNLMSAM